MVVAKALAVGTALGFRLVLAFAQSAGARRTTDALVVLAKRALEILQAPTALGPCADNGHGQCIAPFVAHAAHFVGDRAAHLGIQIHALHTVRFGPCHLFQLRLVGAAIGHFLAKLAVKQRLFEAAGHVAKEHRGLADAARIGHVAVRLHAALASGRQRPRRPVWIKVSTGAGQSDAFIRWRIEIQNDCQDSVWTDISLFESWISYYSSTKKGSDLCYVVGNKIPIAEQHPAKLRNDGDKAKLISSNDTSGFTFRGRFLEAEQACTVGFEVTQKAHSALRWLISRQGYRRGEQAVVAWATSGKEIPDPLEDTFSILGLGGGQSDSEASAYTAQELALKLKQRIAGYGTDLGHGDRVVVMGMGSATPGRMAISFYRELDGSDFLQRIDNWHETCSWIHDYRSTEVIDTKTGSKKRVHVRFIGAPAPSDIAEAAYGGRVDDKLRKSTVERILPCIIDGQKIPQDLVASSVQRASNRIGMDDWEWNKTLSIACALYRKYHEEEGLALALDENRKTRDYLYGRLLALADSLEQWALKENGENRQTNAARLMQRFADHPYTTWRTIELALGPYKARLGGKSLKRQRLISEVIALFAPDDFLKDQKLTGEFLLGYHCQREALRNQKDEEKKDE